jgi:hypothetical protein
MRFAIVTEREPDTGKSRCALRRPARQEVATEPDDAKGCADAGAPKNGVIQC